MRISDLSRQSCVPVATIKYYLRERLLPPGVPTARNQAEYDNAHLRRLRLIRALTGVGRLDLSSVRALLAVIDAERASVPQVFEAANRTLFAAGPGPGDDLDVGDERAAVDDLLTGLGWRVEQECPGRETLAGVLAALRRLGCDADIEFFAPFAEAAERLAARELDLVPMAEPVADPAAIVVRTVLFEVALAALRRMAQAHCLRDRYGETAGHLPESGVAGAVGQSSTS